MAVNIYNYKYTPAKLDPVDDAYPEEVDYEVEIISDISGDDITNEDSFYELDDGSICSEKEMLEIYFNDFVSKVETEEEYQKGKKFLIEELGYSEDDFKDHPSLLRIDGIEKHPLYAFEENFNPDDYDYLPNGWCHKYYEDLEEQALEEYDPRQEDEDYEDYLSDCADDYFEWLEECSTDED